MPIQAAGKGFVRPWTPIPDYDDPARMTSGLVDFDPEKCRQCGICTCICPGRSIVLDRKAPKGPDGMPYLRTVVPGINNCVACGCCLAACPEGAVRIVRGYRPGLFYRRLSQSGEMAYPRCYGPEDARKKGIDRRAVRGPAGDGRTGIPNLNKEKKSDMGRKLQKIKLLQGMLSGLLRWTWTEFRRGRFWSDIRAIRSGEPNDLSWAQLMAYCAREVPSKIFLRYKDEVYTYREMDRNANRLAHFLLGLEAGKGQGLCIMMRNSPRYLDLFLGAQKIGMYVVTINPELKGEGLAFIINHSDIEYLVVDAELLGSLEGLSGNINKVKKVIVNDLESEALGTAIPSEMERLARAYEQRDDDGDWGYNPDDKCLIIYTSGTTGLPKGVVYRYRDSGVMKLSLIGNLLLRPSDVYYTCLSLCHGNALFVTFTVSMAVKGTMALSRHFSASRLWDEVRRYQTTVFNTIGSMAPILMKQPELPSDRDHKVRFILSAACPADLWEPFEDRFGVTLYEVYGAVDGGGMTIMNLGTAPLGSLGKPNRRTVYRIVDGNGKEVPTGATGELLFKTSGRRGRVEYYKNPEASKKKSQHGWLHTGDLVRRDEAGFLYFVGRNTESMRKGGENVSAYEVESQIMKHPDVEEVAVYAVPSELAEDEIMASVKVVEEKKLNPSDLILFLSDKLARYAIPRYIRLVETLPKTSTHRVIKGRLQEEGVTEDTFDFKKMTERDA